MMMRVVFLCMAMAQTPQGRPEPPQSPKIERPNIGEKEKKRQDAKHNPGDKRTGIPKAEAPQKQEPAKNADANTEHEERQIEIDDRIALFTLGLVIVGALQILALLYQAHLINRTVAETKKATELTRQSIILSERPQVAVRNVIITPSPMHRQPFILFESGVPVNGHFDVANTGGSPAEIRQSHCIVYVTKDPLPMEHPYEGQPANNPVQGTLPPGGRATGIFSGKPLSKEEGDMITLGGR